MKSNKKLWKLFLIGGCSLMFLQTVYCVYCCIAPSGMFINEMLALSGIFHIVFSIFAGIKSYQYTERVMMPSLIFALINFVDIIYICLVPRSMLCSVYPGDLGLLVIFLVFFGCAIVSTPLFSITTLFAKLSKTQNIRDSENTL